MSASRGGESDGEDDRDLVAEALRGKEAYARLVARYQGQVYGSVLRLVRHHPDAEDVTQEAFIRAYRRLADYDPRYRFSTWVTRIALNLAISLLRRRGRRPHVSLTDLAEPAAGEGAGVEVEEGVPALPIGVIEGALASLRPAHRAAFVLFHFEERSYAEIGEVLDVPLSSVKNYIHRARRALRKRLAPAVGIS